MEFAPIGADADHATALAQIDRLWGADPASPEGGRLEVLLTLADAYEEAHHAMPASDPVSAVLSMMEQRGLTRRDLEPMIGCRARLSEVLHRQRVLTLPMIRRLSEGLGVPAEIFVREHPIQRAA